jgi:hypothetical protein
MKQNMAVTISLVFKLVSFEAWGGAVGIGTALQVQRLRDRFPDGVIGIFL